MSISPTKRGSRKGGSRGENPDLDENILLLARFREGDRVLVRGKFFGYLMRIANDLIPFHI